MDPLSLIAFATLVGAALGGGGPGSESFARERRRQQLQAWALAFEPLGLRTEDEVSVAMDLFISRGAHAVGLPKGWRWLGERAARTVSSDPPGPHGIDVFVWRDTERYYSVVLPRQLEPPVGWEDQIRSDEFRPSDAVRLAFMAWLDKHPNTAEHSISELRRAIWDWNNSIHAAWWPLDEGILVQIGDAVGVDPWAG